MENKIACANCQEVFEVTGSSIQLPWTCAECVEAAKFQEKIAPAGVAFESDFETEAAQEKTDCCESASVEATTLLIADLETQVKKLTVDNAVLVETVGDQNEVIENQKRLLLRAANSLSELGRSARQLIEDNKKLAITHQYTKNEKQQVIEDLDKLYARFAGFRRWTKDLIDTQVREARRLSEEKEYYKGRADRMEASFRSQMSENIHLRARGFWARVFNAGV